MKKLVFAGIVVVVLLGAFVISTLYVNALNKKIYEDLDANSDAYISTFSKAMIKTMSVDSALLMMLGEQPRAATELENYLKENISLSFSPYESGFLRSNAKITLYFKSIHSTVQGDVEFYNMPFGKRAKITLASPDIDEFKDGIFAKISISKGFGDTKIEIAAADIDVKDNYGAIRWQDAKFSYDMNDEFKISEAKFELKLFAYSWFLGNEREFVLIKGAKSYQKYKEPVGLENIFDLSKEIASDFKGSVERIEAKFDDMEFKAENWDFKGEVTLALAKRLASGNVTSGLKKFTITDTYSYRDEKQMEILNLANMKLELDFLKNLDATLNTKPDEIQRTEFVLKSAQLLFDNKKIELTSDLSFAEVPWYEGEFYYESTQEDIKYNLNISSKYSVRELLERYVKEDLMDTNNEIFVIGDEIFKKDEKSGKHTLALALEAKTLMHNPHILINGEDICKTSFGAELALCFGNIDDASDDEYDER
ncbi:hypothetical protein ACRE1U_03705 [Helicobacter himalayensis]|uniref:hypothetical protein n=1 Tax=Helicobacter himalayensis TaxID=1591088 RepID=UPI003D6F0F31